MNPYEDTGGPGWYREPPRRRTAGRLSLLVAVLGGLTILNLINVFRAQSAGGDLHEPAEPRPVTPRGDLADDEKTTIELFERCSRSVAYVNPIIKGVQRTILGDRNVVEVATGSGFVWDRHGHVVTNFHVIKDAAACRVTLPDGSTYDAQLVGRWPEKDIAVVHIDADEDKLFPVSIGTSSDLRVGQKVFAIGNPFGLDFTLTTGVISALNRQIVSPNNRTIQEVIQTDAAINPGNSGGPLLDSSGRVIGMNTAIYSRSGSSAGIGFAVPVDTINRIVPQLIASGRVTRPGLGVSIAPDDVVERLGLKGVLIFGVTEGSAAEKAGLQPTRQSEDGQIVQGDVIVQVGETPTPNQDALLTAFEHYEVGDTVKLRVERNGKQREVQVTLQSVG